MDLRLNRTEVVEAIGDYARRQVQAAYEISGVKLDGNGQGATVSLSAVVIEPETPVVVEASVTELDTKAKPTRTETAKAKARKAAEDKKGDK